MTFKYIKKSLSSGFTLLEVLVALAILTTSLTVLFIAQASSLNHVSKMRDLSIATLLARSKMIDIELLLSREGFTEGEDDESGDFSEEGYEHIDWQYKVSEVEIDISSLCGGDIDDSNNESEDDGGFNCGALLSGFGGIFENFITNLGDSLRLVELKITWSVGKVFSDSISIKTFITRDDLSVIANKETEQG